MKLIGSLLLALTGIVAAVSVCRFEQKKLRVMDGFISLLFYIKGQVDCYNLPLCDILSSRPDGLLGGDDGGCVELGTLLSHNRIYLGAEPYRLLERFCTEFGSTYRDEQLRRCDYYIDALTEQRRALSLDLPTRSRIGSALCICTAIGLAIILW